MQQKGEFCFHIQPASLCLFIGKLSPFLLREINDQGLLVPVIFVSVVGCGIVCAFSFFGICCCEIIYCLDFVTVADFFELEFSF